MEKIVRQGDVMLFRVAALPKGAVAIKTNGDVILAHGEVTGHAHRLALPPVVAGVGLGKQLAVVKPVKLWDAGAERFIQVLEKTALTHEEHSPIPLDPGVYRGVRQHEYAPEEARRQRMVAD